MKLPQSLHSKIEERVQKNIYRSLSVSSGSIDFYSNDYLGIVTSGIIAERLKDKEVQSGSTGSRLLSGNSQFCENLESKIATFHHGEAALIFNSGYDANLGLLSSVPTRHDTIIYDELSHASIIDGANLSYAKNKFSFKHNDCDDLRKKIQNAAGAIYVVVESVYSMDGDFAPLIEIADLCKETGAYLIVDEAHATGIFGNLGEGRVYELGLEDVAFARIHTFGKALGCHGAAVIGAGILKEYLINFARSFIYTTSLPPHSLHAIDEAYNLLITKEVSPVQLFLHVHEFTTVGRKEIPAFISPTHSPIQTITIGNSKRAKELSIFLQQHDIEARAIVSPTVKEGAERLRICLHTFNVPQEIQLLISKTKEFLR